MAQKGMKKRGFAAGVLIIVALALLVSADPPIPHGISGHILYPGGGQVPLGTPYEINDSTAKLFISGITSFPVQSGWFSEVIRGSELDMVQLLAWNSTAFGELNITLAGDMELNITLNKTRPPEINISIKSPGNNTTYNLSQKFKLNTSIIALGGSDAQDCNFTIGFNTSFLSLDTGESYTHNLASVARVSFVYLEWNLSSVGAGSSNVTVNSSCNSDSRNIFGLTKDTLQNITINGSAIPLVKIISPRNNTEYLNSTKVVFKFNVSSAANIGNCTLFVNGTSKNHTHSPSKDVQLSLTALLGLGKFNWTINCSDVSFNTGSSGRRNLTVSASSPSISLLQIQNPINLLAGSNKEVVCNGTAETISGFSNIAEVNATFYFKEGGFDAGDADDNSSHYTALCTLGDGSGSAVDFACVFNLTYYASAGEWQCNATVLDLQNHINRSTINTNVSELYAIMLPTELDYGLVLPNQVSDEKPTGVQNQGNVDINISVRGYGRNEGDDYAMVCERGNISIADQHFNTTTGLPYTTMYSLAPSFFQIPGFTVPRTMEEAVYWRIRPGLGLSGSCNGTIIFSVVVQ